MECKSILLSHGFANKKCFILTIWNVNQLGHDLAFDAISLFYINYMECKFRISSKEL